MKRVLLIALLSICQFAFSQDRGTVVGLVTDKEMSGEPLPFANVFIKGTSIGSTTDMDGKYTIQAPVGNQIIVFSFVGYQTVEKPIVVKAGQTITVNQEVGASEGVALDEVEVKATVNKERESALLLEQKKAVAIQTKIGAQELSRKGVSDVEQAVTKTTGITKVASRGIFVRGLDERYNFLTMNGLPISPSNWENKIPSLSQFSSSILQSVDINKVFYSNLYGDFAGASMNVSTKARPRKSYTKISMSAGSNFQSLSSDFLTDKENGNVAFLGFGGKDARKPPKELSNKEYKTAGVYVASGQKAVNDFQSDWNIEKIDTPISIGFGIENAGVFDGEDSERTAYYIGVNYSNSYDSKIGKGILRTPNKSLIRNVNRSNSFGFSTSNNALLGFFNKTDKRELTFNYLFLKKTSNNVGDNYGRFTEASANLMGIDANFKQSVLNQIQILGNHRIGESNKLNYGLTYGSSNYAQPDNNILKIEEKSDNSFVFAASSGKMYKYFLDSENNNFGGTISYDLLFNASNSEEDKQNKFTFGADYNNETLDVYNRALTINAIVGEISINPKNIDDSLKNAFLKNDAEYKEQLDNRFTKIKTSILAGFLSYNHNFNDKFSATLGTRLEQFKRNVGDGNAKNVTFDKFLVLPSLNLRYQLSDNMNLRFATSKTYTKPKNIEIVDIERENSVGDLLTGNPNLMNSENYGADLKWEYFPDRNSLFSINIFGKLIKNPIERLVEDKASYIRTVFRNTDDANLYGAEIEIKSTLGSITSKEELEKFTFGANITLMQSKVNLSDDLITELNLTNKNRRLQGASDFLVNADVGYKFDYSENSNGFVSLLYDTYSKRISAVGSSATTNKYDDEYENPFHNLSFVWKNNFNKKVGVGIKVSNILNGTYKRNIRTTLDRTIVGSKQYKIGTSASLSLSYKF